MSDSSSSSSSRRSPVKTPILSSASASANSLSPSQLPATSVTSSSSSSSRPSSRSSFQRSSPQAPARTLAAPTATRSRHVYGSLNADDDDDDPAAGTLTATATVAATSFWKRATSFYDTVVEKAKTKYKELNVPSTTSTSITTSSSSSSSSTSSSSTSNSASTSTSTSTAQLSSQSFDTSLHDEIHGSNTTTTTTSTSPPPSDPIETRPTSTSTTTRPTIPLPRQEFIELEITDRYIPRVSTYIDTTTTSTSTSTSTLKDIPISPPISPWNDTSDVISEPESATSPISTPASPSASTSISTTASASTSTSTSASSSTSASTASATSTSTSSPPIDIASLPRLQDEWNALFWIIHQISHILTSSQGGWLTPSVYIPHGDIRREPWFMDSLRIVAFPLKVQSCEQLHRLLQTLQATLNFYASQAEKRVIAMNGFVDDLGKLQNTLAFQLTFIQEVETSETKLVSHVPVTRYERYADKVKSLSYTFAKNATRIKQSALPDKITSDQYDRYTQLVLSVFHECQCLVSLFNSCCSNADLDMIRSLVRVGRFLSSVLLAFIVDDLMQLTMRYQQHKQQLFIQI